MQDNLFFCYHLHLHIKIFLVGATHDSLQNVTRNLRPSDHTDQAASKVVRVLFSSNLERLNQSRLYSTKQHCQKQTKCNSDKYKPTLKDVL